MPSILTTVLMLLGTASLALAGVLMDPQPPDGHVCPVPLPPIWMFPPLCLNVTWTSAASTNLRVPSTGMLLLLVLAITILSSTFVMAGGPAESQPAIAIEEQNPAAALLAGDNKRTDIELCYSDGGVLQNCMHTAVHGWVTVTVSASTALKAPAMILLLLVAFATTVLGSPVVSAGGLAETRSAVVDVPFTNLVASGRPKVDRPEDCWAWCIRVGQIMFCDGQRDRCAQDPDEEWDRLGLDPLGPVYSDPINWDTYPEDTTKCFSYCIVTLPGAPHCYNLSYRCPTPSSNAVVSAIIPSTSALKPRFITHTHAQGPSLDHRANDQVSAATPNCGLDCSDPGPPRSYPSTPISSAVITRSLLMPTGSTTTTHNSLVLTGPETSMKPLPGSTVTQTVIVTITETERNRVPIITTTYTQPGSIVPINQTVSLRPKTITETRQRTVMRENSTETVTYTKPGSTVIATRTVSLPPVTITETRQQNITFTVPSTVTRTQPQPTTMDAREPHETPSHSPTTTLTDTNMMLPSPPQPTWGLAFDDEPLLLDFDIHEVLNGLAFFSERYLQRGADGVAQVIDNQVDKNPHPLFELLGETAKSWVQNAEDIVGDTLVDFPDVIFGKPQTTEEVKL